MSNITSLQIGQNKIEIEGKWVIASNNLINHEFNKAKGTYTYDLSQYLPNDDYIYELYIHVSIGENSNELVIATVKTDLENRTQRVITLYPWTNNVSQYNDNDISLLIGKERKVYVNFNNSPQESAVQILKYKRLYKDTRILED
jgi:hypothetical protein